jgi:dihydropteroate synthase
MANVPGLPAPGRTLVMGVLNVTPDSFSDGGRYLDFDAAVRHGLDLVADGADVVDIGGESTRPGADRVPVEVERERVLPVVRELAAAGVPLSIDTTRAKIAEAALDAGALIVNDVSGGLADPAMYKTVAAAGAPYIAMHNRGASIDMASHAVYDDVVAEVCIELRQRLDAALEAGISADRLVVDPGIGFAKTGEHNWRLLSQMDAIAALGYPVLVGVSRKRFLGVLLAGSDGEPRAIDDRDDATTALTAILAAGGVWGIRVHAVRPSADAVRAIARLDEERA